MLSFLYSLSLLLSMLYPQKMKLLTWLLRIFRFKPRWNGTPEMFLALTLEMQEKNNRQFSATEVLQWGAVMQKMIKVNLYPYRDFEELLRKGKPDFSQVWKMREKLNERQQRIELKQALYGNNVPLGEDDLMTSNAEDAVFTRRFISELSQHVRFSDDDQKTIEGWKNNNGA